MPGHTWQSLKDRYKKKILPALQASEALSRTTPRQAITPLKTKPITPPVKFIFNKPNGSKHGEKPLQEEDEVEDDVEEMSDEGETNKRGEEDEEGEEAENEEEENEGEEAAEKSGVHDSIVTPPSTVKKALDSERWAKTRKVSLPLSPVQELNL